MQSLTFVPDSFTPSLRDLTCSLHLRYSRAQHLRSYSLKDGMQKLIDVVGSPLASLPSLHAQTGLVMMGSLSYSTFSLLQHGHPELSVQISP